MTTQIRALGRHHDDVARAHFDLLVAPGAEVLLAGLVGLHLQDLERPETLGGVGHPGSGEQGPGEQEDYHDDCADDHGVVGFAGALPGPERVEAHGPEYGAAMAASDPILTNRTDGVLTVTLNRPEKKNAVTGQMWGELRDLFREAAADPEVRVVVVTGAGGAFCSGADLTAIDDLSAGGLHRMRVVGSAALALHDMPKPTIAKVGGIAAGAGANLALGCDLIVAGETARFSEIFTARGLSLDFGGSWLLPRLVGLHKAKELAYFAEIISAKQAEDLGLVNRVVADADLDAFVNDWARRLAAGPPVALSLTKHMLNASAGSTMAEALEREAQSQTINFGTQDMAEAVRAFIEKRPPRFQGK